MKKNLKLSLSAGSNSMSIGTLEHPNKMPFTGLLTYFDIPSDKVVGGAKGKKVVITSEYGIPGLASLKGMAIDFDPLLMDKHVIAHKIGVIEDAWAGDTLPNGAVPVYVKGYVFAYDFPDEASDIKEFQLDLGFSYETINTPVMLGTYNGEAVLLACGEVIFSGAAILLAEKAAYTQTSLAAQAVEIADTIKEMEGTILGEGMEPAMASTPSMDDIVYAVMCALEAKYEMQTKQEAVAEATEEVAEAVGEVLDALDELTSLTAESAEPVVVEEVVEPVIAPAVEVPAVEPAPVIAEVPATVDFQAQAIDLQASNDALTAELASLKAEAIIERAEVAKHTHKGFAYPTTLAAKYNLEASADTYEAQIAIIDARTDLDASEATALKWELRSKELGK